MAIFTSADHLQRVKDHLLITHDADDIYLAELIDDAPKRFEAFIQRPIEHEDPITESFRGGRDKLILSYFPVDVESVVVFDNANNDALDDNQIEVEPMTGFVYRVSSFSRKPQTWSKGINRWTVTYKSGLVYHPQWEHYIKETLKVSFIDLISDWYESRSPGLQEERFGGGSVVSYAVRRVPERILQIWEEIGADIYK